MSEQDSFVIYVKGTPLGQVLTARYEVHDGNSWAIIGGDEMTDAWMKYSRLPEALARLHEAALTAALNTPDERQTQLDLEGF